MKKIIIKFTVFLINDKRLPEHPDVRVKVGIVEGWVSILTNLLLFFIKIAAGISISSSALIADAFHTLADSATSVVVIAGFKISKKPSDTEHPFGHGRIEPVSTLIISILLFVAGIEFFHNSINNFIHPSIVSFNLYIVILISFTAVIKEFLALFSYTLGEYIDSDTLKADGHHHRSDVFATLMVVLGLIAAKYGFFRVDAVMGCFVSTVILITAYTIAKEAIKTLLGEAPPPELLDKIEKISINIPGVIGVHDIISHQYGQNRITSLHIEVSHQKTALELHMIAEEIEDIIGSITNGLAVVHIDPVNRSHPGYCIISKVLGELLEKDDRITSFYDLKIIGESIETASIIFNISTDENISETENHSIIRDLSASIKEKFPKIRVRVKVNPKYSYTSCQ